jgi:hypothetical protein
MYSRSVATGIDPKTPRVTIPEGLNTGVSGVERGRKTEYKTIEERKRTYRYSE